jgi:hypothetical protein
MNLPVRRSKLVWEDPIVLNSEYGFVSILKPQLDLLLKVFLYHRGILV